jgi:hypothetical protein
MSGKIEANAPMAIGAGCSGVPPKRFIAQMEMVETMVCVEDVIHPPPSIRKKVVYYY